MLVPEDWINEDVVLITYGDEDSYDGTLLDVNDRGVVIRFWQNFEQMEEASNQGEEVGERLYVRYFFPWHEVVAIAQREKQE